MMRRTRLAVPERTLQLTNTNIAVWKNRVAAVNKDSMDNNVRVIKVNDSNARTDASASEDNALRLEINGAQESSAALSASSGGDETEPLVQCVLDFPASAIKKLKSEAGGGHTSFECISAHFWKLVAAAREDAASVPTFFFSPVNCRACVTPPVPSSYFGNVVAIDATWSTVGAIQREILCATACRIRNLVSRVKAEDNVVAFMHWLETHNNRVVDKVMATMVRKGEFTMVPCLSSGLWVGKTSGSSDCECARRGGASLVWGTPRIHARRCGDLHFSS